MGRRSRNRGGNRLVYVVLAAGVGVVLLSPAVLSSVSWTSVFLERGETADVVQDSQGIHALNIPRYIECDLNPHPLISLTNRLGVKVNETVELTTDSKADLYFGGSNQDDKVEFVNPQGDTKQVNASVTDCVGSLVFDVTATSDGILAYHPNRRILIKDFLRWFNTTDWDNAVTENGTVHEDFGDRRSDLVYLGYPSTNYWDVTPVSYWHFDENSGSTAVDVAGGNNGTTFGVGMGVNGILNSTSFRFDGNDYISTDRNLNPVLNNTATLSAWIKTTQTGDDTMWQAPGITGVESAGDGNDIFWGWINASGHIGIQVGGVPGAMSNVPINDGEWHHVVFTRNASNGVVEVYVDGEFNGSATSRVANPTTPFNSIGRIEDTAGTPEYFVGKIDEVRIYDTKLNASQINQIYTAGHRGNLTTGWKTANTVQNVSELKLRTVNATLNNGSINITVESDTDADGTPEEVSSPIALNGSGGPYDVRGLSTDNDRFRLRIEMTTPNVTKSPCLSGVELSDGSTTGFAGFGCGVSLANKIPDANFSYSPTHPVTSRTVKFNASNSSDLDGNITTYSWDFGDGTTATGEVVTHKYSLPGFYTVTLTVTDDDGLTDTVTKQILVRNTFLRWFNTTDWDNAVTENGTVHEDFGDHVSDVVQLGYPTGGQWGPQPVAYYPFDEDTGTTATDVINGYNGQINNSDIVGRNGMLSTTSFGFNGNDVVDLGSGGGTLSTAISNGPYSWSGWVNVSPSTNIKTIVSGTGFFSYSVIIFTYNSYLYVYEGSTGNFYRTATPVADGTWHHFTVTYDGTQVNAYVDGQQAGGDFPTNANLDIRGYDLLQIGEYGSGYGGMVGRMDEIQAYNRSLSPAEINSLYSASQRGNITTGWKTANATLDVSKLQLQNVSATLNRGTVNITVESDTDGDGVPDEVSSPISLNGSGGPYEVRGLSTDNDRFRLHIEFTTPDVTVTPKVSRLRIDER